MSDQIQKQMEALARLQHAAQELNEARAKRPDWRVDDIPTPEEEAAEVKRDDAIADLRSADLTPQSIADKAGMDIKDVYRILHARGLADEWEPMARRERGDFGPSND